MADNSGSGISEHGIAHFHNLVARVPAVIVEGAGYVCVSLRSVSPAGADCRKLARRRRRHDAAVSNPSTGATLGQIPNMGGRKRNRQWMPPRPRCRLARVHRRPARRAIENWHRLILENKTALAQIMTAEQGKPLAEAEGEIAYAAASFIEWFAEQRGNAPTAR